MSIDSIDNISATNRALRQVECWLPDPAKPGLGAGHGENRQIGGKSTPIAIRSGNIVRREEKAMLNVAETDRAETQRLSALHAYDVLDTPAEESFDRITRLVCQILDTPIAVISFVDTDRQWFKSRQGLEAQQTPRSMAFCDHTIRTDTLMIVRNALEDERFRDNPLVTGDPNIRFYAGHPLRTPDGHNIGSLCAIDHVPRDLSPSQRAALADLARLVVDGLEFRNLAIRDSLTGALTRRAFETQAVRDISRARRHDRPLSLILFDIDHFKKINDCDGHDAGDAVLSRMIGRITPQLRAHDLFARLGGEEFAILLAEDDIDGATALAERIRESIQQSPFRCGARIIPVTASFGVSTLGDGEMEVAAMLKRADEALYAAKQSGRNRVARSDQAA
jgi:diguanylate cyclase (GGDEF)-like protein